MATCVRLSHQMKFTLAAAATTTTCVPFVSCPWINFFREKQSQPEIYASGSSRHQYGFSPLWKTLHSENLVFFVCAADGRVIYCDTIRTFTVVYVHDTWSVSDCEVLCSCFMQHYLYNTQHFVSCVHKLWKLSTLHVSLIPRTVQFKKLNEEF